VAQLAKCSGFITVKLNKAQKHIFYCTWMERARRAFFIHGQSVTIATRWAALQKPKEDTMTQQIQPDQQVQLDEGTATQLIETDIEEPLEEEAATPLIQPDNEELPKEDTANSWISNIWRKITGNR
jgi:hypothetical protein